MDEKCDPQVFYHRIRPYLAGSKGMENVGLPRGVFYDEGDGKGQWRALRGGSNGQSSLIQFWDLVLGVEHVSCGGKGKGGSGGRGFGGCMAAGGQGKAADGGEPEMSFHEEVRGYMPEPHRRFLEYVAKMGGGGGMRKAIMQLREETRGDPTPAQVELEEAFQGATRALAAFRNKHLQIVTRYIIIPSRQSAPEQLKEGKGVVNLATASLGKCPVAKDLKTSCGNEEEVRCEKSDSVELTGTGGTALLPFLKQTRDETYQAGEIR